MTDSTGSDDEFLMDSTDVHLTALALIKAMIGPSADLKAARILLPEDNFTASVMVNLATLASIGIKQSAADEGMSPLAFVDELIRRTAAAGNDEP